MNFDKMGLGYILGDFFTNSTGHPVTTGIVRILFMTGFQFRAEGNKYFSRDESEGDGYKVREQVRKN
jgi:hypothetical protein